jgi:hypothetical protein
MPSFVSRASSNVLVSLFTSARRSAIGARRAAHEHTAASPAISRRASITSLARPVNDATVFAHRFGLVHRAV